MLYLNAYKTAQKEAKKTQTSWDARDRKLITITCSAVIVVSLFFVFVNSFIFRDFAEDKSQLLFLLLYHLSFFLSHSRSPCVVSKKLRRLYLYFFIYTHRLLYNRVTTVFKAILRCVYKETVFVTASAICSTCQSARPPRVK